MLRMPIAAIWLMFGMPDLLLDGAVGGRWFRVAEFERGPTYRSRSGSMAAAGMALVERRRGWPPCYAPRPTATSARSLVAS